MHQFLLALSLVVCCFSATAKQTSPPVKHPCSTPALQLYNEQKKQLSEGAIPNGKVTAQLVKDIACAESVTYEIEKVYVVLVRGHLPLAHTTVEGNVIDLTEMQAKFRPGDRLYLDLQKVKYKTDKGKTGHLVHGVNWIFKKD